MTKPSTADGYSSDQLIPSWGGGAAERGGGGARGALRKLILFVFRAFAVLSPV